MRKIFEKNGYVKKFLNRFFLYFFKRNILQNAPTKDAVSGKEFFHLLSKGVIDRLIDFATLQKATLWYQTGGEGIISGEVEKFSKIK